MDFIVDNYIWFIVGGVILIMTLIGYIADKTEFVENQKAKDKEKKVKQEKKKKEKKSKEQEIFEKQINNGKNLVLEEGSIDYPVEIEEKPEEEIPVEVDTSFEDQMTGEDGLNFEEPIPAVEDTLSEVPSDSNNIDFETPIASVPESQETPVMENTFEGIDPDIMKPLEGGVLNLDKYAEEPTITEPVIEEPTLESPTLDTAAIPAEEVSEPPLPEVEEIKPAEESSFNDTSDDDVWKF